MKIIVLPFQREGGSEDDLFVVQKQRKKHSTGDHLGWWLLNYSDDLITRIQRSCMQMVKMLAPRQKAERWANLNQNMWVVLIVISGPAVAHQATATFTR